MVKPCLLLLAGGLAAQHSTLLLASDPSGLLLVASLCLLLMRRGRAVAMFLGGYAVFMLAAGDVIGKRLHADYAGDSMRATVRISGFPEVNGDSVVLVVEPLSDHRIPPRVRLSWFEPRHVPAQGEVWELELRLRQPRGTQNPGAFDFESWLFREKLHATGYVVGGKRNRLLWSGTATAIERFRARFAQRAGIAAQSTATAGVLAAVGVGLRHQVSRAQWDRFAISGTSHLMAISGLHVGLAAMVAFVFFYALLGVLPGNAYTRAVVAGAACALAYALVSGFGVPARRAVVMLGVAALTVLRRRQLDPAAAVALAAGAVFVTDPVATLKPGFDLSFAAVVLLLWLARRGIAPSVRPRWLEAPRQLLTMQVFLLLGLLPLTALVFQRLAVISTPVNMLAVPLFSMVTVPLTLAGLVIGEFSAGAANGLLAVAARSIDLLDRCIGFMVSIPQADVRLAGFHGAALLLLCLPLAWVVLPPGWPGRRLAIPGILAILMWRPEAPPESCFDAWVLDAGQGLAVAIQTREDVVLFDTGMAWRGGGSVAAQTILPFLRSRGIGRIDHLLVSHADLDHAGGTGVIHAAVGVGRTIAGEEGIAGADGLCRAGQHWTSAGVTFAILHPSPGSPAAGNAASCVLRVAAGSHGFLLTGDIEAASETALLQTGADLHSDVVVVPHHGSLTSSTVPFIHSVQPGYAVVSAGHANRWGFPRQRIVERWRAAGARVLNTAESGAIHFRVCKWRGVRFVRQERQRRHRFWHAET